MTKYYISTYYINAYIRERKILEEPPEIVHLLLYIGAKDESQMFDRLEYKIKEYLEKFQNTDLKKEIYVPGEDIPLEALGEFYFKTLGDLLKQQDFELYQLEVYLTPMRRYKVSDRLLLPFQYPKDVVERIEHMREWSRRLYAEIEEKENRDG